MQDPIAACFGGGGAAKGALSSSTPAEALVSTSVYETDAGEATFTWFRTALGLSLRVDLDLPSAAAPSFFPASPAAAAWEEDAHSFRLRPWLLWKRRGTQRFRSAQKKDRKKLVVDFAWDLRKARFPAGGGPQPAGGYFVSISVAGKLFLVVGDMETEAYKKAKYRRSSINGRRALLLSKKEHVVFPSSGRTYRTRARIGGQEKEIFLDLSGAERGRDGSMRVALDGEIILDVNQLEWKFRGNEKVELMGGAAAIHVSWDVHRWLFRRDPDPSATAAAAAAAHFTGELGDAVLIFRFEGQKSEEEDGGGMRRSGKRWGLRKTESSSSSSSAASSGRSSSIMDWASAEEEELQNSESSSLLVSIWKS